MEQKKVILPQKIMDDIQIGRSSCRVVVLGDGDGVYCIDKGTLSACRGKYPSYGCPLRNARTENDIVRSEVLEDHEMRIE